MPTLALLLSSFLFAVVGVLIKKLGDFGVGALMITFSRFAVGFLGSSLIYLALRKRPKVNRWDLVITRGITNLVAAALFYMAIQLTNVTKANVLNMSYPIFIALLTPVFIREKVHFIEWIGVALSFAGVWLILDPSLTQVQVGELVGLASSLTAAMTIIVLRQARKFDDSNSIVWGMMLVGFIFTLPFSKGIFTLNNDEMLILLASSLIGVVAQWLMTYSQKYVTAAEGGVVATSRIIFAGLLGYFLLNEQLSWGLALGAILILLSITLVSYRENQKKRKLNEQKA